ncbi:hypothetical protein C474_17694 [Halogeometricum pallidum JCM 14848]|uniref:DUF7310 domain-containing protein n=1 Tax=Halogeometricum pallidum JCM 14848 TaxID=1227487 RepID=M0CX38_HALPD|nr:hypothetical protein [Halogeometricum pallidum]ELZ27203.1 hypothetical protein C474_17694 [Halogeometricum pallidum JCM 14848]
MPNDRTDTATLAARLDAVERALTDETRTAPGSAAEREPASTDPDDSDLSGALNVPDAPGAESERSDAVAADGDAVRRLERRVEELAAELDAVRGLLGGVEAVNESVERRANLALAAAERARTDRETDGLVVERLPDGDDVRDDRSSAVDAVEAEREDSAASLAARLREAL